MIRAAFVAFCVAGLLLAAPTRAQVAGTASADDTARLLAGMQPSSNSPLARLADDPSSKQHASLFDAAFDKLETERLGKMREWSAANLTAPRAMMYYLFSGPDFLHANAFFPDRKSVV